MKLLLKINMDSAAFENGAHDEAARILREAAGRIEAGAWTHPLFDINGNKVGEVKVQMRQKTKKPKII